MSTTTHATLNIIWGATKKEYPLRTYFKNQSATIKSSTQAKRNKKTVPVFYMGLILAAILSVSPANANYLATTASGTRVFITGKFNDASFNLCAFHFNFEQRMIINGQSMMVLTQSVYTPGAHDLILFETCEGYNIYDVSSGNSLTVDFPNPSTTNDPDNKSTEITKPATIQLIAAPEHRDYLWIRKRK